MKRRIALLLVFCLLGTMIPTALADEIADNAEILENVEIVDEVDDDTLFLDLSEVADDGEDDESMVVELDDIELEDLSIDDSDLVVSDGEEEEFEEVGMENAAASGVPKTLTLGLKQSFTLNPSKIAKGKNVTYKSSKTAVATVSKKGVITAKKKGVAKIGVIVNKKIVATCKVTVVAAPKKVALGTKSVNLGVKETYQIVPKLPRGTMASFTYSTKNKKIATVTKAGVVKGVKVGKTTITVTTHNKKKATLTVNVRKAPSKVTLNTAEATLTVGETLQLKAKLPNKTASALTWTSSAKNVATVDEKGLVTAVAPGTAKITVKTFNKKKATCIVTVGGMIGVDSDESDIKMVQELLYKLGLLPQEGITGVYDLNTENAVREFQIWAVTEGGYSGIGITGIVDPATLAALRASEGKIIVLDSDMGESEIVIPYGQETIGSGTLNLSGRVRVYIPETVKEIAEDAFAGAESVTIYSPEGSYAQTFAENHGIRWENCGARYLEDQTDAFLLKLDELEAQSTDEITAVDTEHISTEGITDRVLVAVINEFNDTLDEMKESQQEIEKHVQEVGEACEGIAGEINRYTVEATDSKITLGTDELVYAIYTENLDKLKSNCTVISIKTTEAEDSILIETINEGSRLWIQLTGNEMRVLDKQQANTVSNAYVMPVTERAIIRSNSVISAIWNTIQQAVNNVDNWMGTLSVGMAEALKYADEQVELAIKELAGADSWADWARMKTLNYEEMEVEIFARSAYDKAAQNWKNAALLQKALRGLNGVLAGFSVKTAIKDIKDNIQDYNDLTRIVGHGHPTEDDTGIKYDLAIEMMGDLQAAQILLVMDTGLGLIDVVDTLSTVIGSIGALLTGPLGFLGLAAKKLAVKATKETVKAAMKKVAAQFIIDGSASALVQSTKSKDKKLHDTGTLSGTVIDEDTKEPLEGVYVSCDGCNTVTTTDSSGQYTLEKVQVGECTITFSKKAYRKAPYSVTVDGDKVTKRDASLKKSSGTIQGTVYDLKTKEPLSGVTVSCEGCESVTTGADGSYIIMEVPEGENKVTFSKPLYRSVPVTVNVVDQKVSTVSRSLRKAVGTVMGEVRDEETGEPLEGVSVSCEGYGSTATGSDGKYVLEEVPEGENTLNFTKPKYKKVSGSVNVIMDRVSSLDVKMKKATGTVMGTVYDKETNGPLQGVSVSCEGCESVTTGTDGRYMLENVPEGENEIIFTKDLYKTERQKVEVSFNQQSMLNIKMEISSGEVELQVLDHQTETPLSNVAIKCDCDGVDVGITDSEGKCVLENVPLREVKFTLTKDRYDTVNYTVMITSSPVTVCIYMRRTPIEINEVNFPDPCFRTSIRENYDDDGDGFLSGLEIDEVKKIALTEEDVYTFKGLEFFTEARKLVYRGAWETKTLDLSGMINLEEIECYLCGITSINVSGCTRLKVLSCRRLDALTNLDYSGCNDLEKLCIQSHSFKDLDISKCANLKVLDLCDTPLTNLDLSANEKLERLDLQNTEITGLNLKANKNLNCLFCGDNYYLTDINLCGLTKLTEVYARGSAINSLNVVGCAGLENLDCTGNALINLDLSGCTSLKSLSCNNNKLTRLDVHALSNLESLGCGENMITHLDVLALSNLESLECGENMITHLDVHGLTNLQRLGCLNNELTHLNASGCKRLESLVISTGKELNFSGCESLTELWLTFPKIESLIVSGCTNLTSLYCGNSAITSLDVSGLSKLKSLYCINNLNMRHLYLRGCTGLTYLDYRSTPLEDLDLSDCPVNIEIIKSN